MSLHLLMITLADKEELSVHPDHGSAWAALLRFVDDRWSALLGSTEAPDDETARVDAFFALPDAFYLIGENGGAIFGHASGGIVLLRAA